LDLIQYFFKEYLPTHRGVSPNTEKSYRDAMKLFLGWLKENGKPTDGSLFTEIKTEDVLDFLKHLEKKRKNCVATRNSRLAALKAFFFVCYLMRPKTKPAMDILQFIPMKKTSSPIIF
jgi:integrase/recombinase XerD